jgi:hypothetical protein
MSACVAFQIHFEMLNKKREINCMGRSFPCSSLSLLERLIVLPHATSGHQAILKYHRRPEKPQTVQTDLLGKL